MTRQQIHEGLGSIEAMFDRSYSDAGVEYLVENLKDSPSSAFLEVIKRLEDSGEQRMLPAPKELARMVRAAAGEQADRKQDAKVEQLKKERQDWQPDKEGFKVFQALNRLMFSGRATRREILEKIREADKIRPNAGWALCGESLKRMYEKRGLDLDQKPNNGFMEGT